MQRLRYARLRVNAKAAKGTQESNEMPLGLRFRRSSTTGSPLNTRLHFSRRLLDRHRMSAWGPQAADIGLTDIDRFLDEEDKTRLMRHQDVTNSDLI
jgi:hypothetical protein